MASVRECPLSAAPSYIPTVTFDQAVDALGALASEGVAVEASVWGNDPGAAPLMTEGGLLRRMEPSDVRLSDGWRVRT